VKRQQLIKILEQIGVNIDSSGHASWCYSNDQLGVYCTCGKEKAQDLCNDLIEDLKKDKVSD
jgi:hypothetical protein